jgi:hypothetical protein
MPESVPGMHCPTVPFPGSGTVGQSAPAIGRSGTTPETIIGTPRLKALEKLALLRDRQRDSERDSGQVPSVPGVPLPGQNAGLSGTIPTPVPNTGRRVVEIIASASLDLGTLPSGPCLDCGGRRYSRLSVLSEGRPGPWTCQRCVPPDPADWIDGCALPVGQIEDLDAPLRSTR